MRHPSSTNVQIWTFRISDGLSCFGTKVDFRQGVFGAQNQRQKNLKMDGWKTLPKTIRSTFRGPCEAYFQGQNLVSNSAPPAGC